MKKRINLDALVWMLLLLFYALSFGYLYASGKIYHYIHPKMHKYVLFLSIVMLILFVVQIKNIFSIQTKMPKLGYILFILPLLFLYTQPLDNMGSALSEEKYVGMSSEFSASNKSKEETKKKEADLAPEDKELPSQGQETKESNFVEDGHIFLETLDEIYGQEEIDTEKSYHLKGFVYRDENMAENQFVVARLMIVCCVADAQTIGLLCQYEGAAALSQGQWVEVDGTLFETEDVAQDGSGKIPAMKVDVFKLSEQTGTGYVYP